MQNDNLENNTPEQEPATKPLQANEMQAGQTITPGGTANNTTELGLPPQVPDHTGKKSKLNKILWAVIFLAAAPVVLILASFGVLAAIAQSGGSGTELMALYLIPVALILPYILPLAIVCAAILLFRDHNFIHKLLLIVLIFIFGVFLVPSANLLFSSNQFDKELDSATTVGLINDCKIESIVMSEQDKVDLRYADDGYGKPTNRPHYADPNSYGEYVSAAKAMDGKCGDLVIVYQNHLEGQSDDPTWPGDRWVSKDEAIDAILACKVNIVLTHIRPHSVEKDEPVKGTKTNIALVESADLDMAGDIFVYSAAESIQTNEEISDALDEASRKCGFEAYTDLVDKENIEKLNIQ